MVLKTANAVPPSQQNRAKQPRQGTAKSTKSTASSSSVGRGTGNDGGRRHNRTPSGAAGSAAASSNVPSGGKPTPKKKKKKPKQQTKKEESHEPVRRTVKPPNQLVLTGAERTEDVSLLLTAADPNRPKNAVVSFSHRDMCFKPDPPGQGDNMAVHFSLAGSMMHVDGDEYKRYEEAEARSREREEALLADEEGDGVVVPAVSPADGDAAAGGVRDGRAKNQFNFSERATQSHNNPQKDRAVHTEPPPVTQYSDEVSQWMIFDSYKSDFLLTESMEKSDSVRNLSFEDRLASIVSSSDAGGDPSSSSSSGGDGKGRGAVDTIHSESMESALKTMERLVNQNAEDEIFQDFKYFEDRADSIRRGEGTLLPLWKFTSARSGRKQVTSLAWNPRYADLFAASYGSYDFLRQGSGVVCCFSLKNTSHPEYVIQTESGATCLDFHPHHPSLLAVGCYDGTVLAYDIGEKRSRPIYSSSLRSGKHSDPVWEVRWHDDPASSSSKGLSFYSVSSDGRVASWAMSKNELKMETIMHLKLVSPASKREDCYPDGGGGEPTLSGLAGGCTFDFNGKLDNLFLVGTEEGSIHECSRAYSGQYINTYDGHHMGVHAVRWNPFHEDIFISCSADWTVKIWDHNDQRCLLHFDLGNAVGDVCWSPFSSTVFAAVTTDGRVHVFDLAQNKRDPLCAQRIVKKSRLTNATFNLKDFILIAGDDRGAVHSLKLSPNLRREAEVVAVDEGGETPDPDFVQRSRLREILNS